MARVVHYFDYKSPYAYLAQADTWALAEAPGVEVEWRPYTLQIGKYLGLAELDTAGSDRLGTRNDHQWRRVRYSYMDCRREANRRGLTVRGPRRIFDSSIAHVAFLYVRERGPFRRFHDTLFERFWRRDIDLEDIGALTALIEETADAAGGFASWLAGPGRRLHDEMQAEAEAGGVFGVPSYVVNGELYWGAERLPRVWEQLGRRQPPTAGG